MKNLILLSFCSLLILSVYGQDYINFYPWTSGSNTGTTTSDPDIGEFGVKTGCITATTTVTNSGGAFQTSNPQFTSSYGTILGLRVGVDWSQASQFTTVIIDLRKNGNLIDLPVQFNIYDINSAVCAVSPSTNRFIDVVNVKGYKRLNNTTVNTGVSYNPNSMSNIGSGNSISGSTITGSPTGGGNISSVVNFSTSICRIEITYSSGTGAPPGCSLSSPWPLNSGENPRRQEIAISPLLITHDCSLPVEFEDFEADCKEDELVLKWSTITEFNNDKFQIFSSDDGTNFNLIAEVDGAGNSEEKLKYQYIVKRNFSKYYRLSQVDHDGTFEILKTISIINSCEKSELDFNIYPNPFEENFTISLNKDISEDFEIRVVDNNNRVIHIDFIEEDAFEKKIDTKNWSKGVYFVQLSNKNDVQFEKVVKY